MNPSEVFETCDVDLAAYLSLEGLRFLDSRKEQDAKPRVVLVFHDPKQVGRDLERNFMNSKERKYQDYRRYLLKEIHRTMKGL